MTKKFLIVSSLLVLGLSSCRKTRVCQCEENGTTLGTFTYLDVKRSEAKSYCQAQQASFATTNPGATCSLR